MDDKQAEKLAYKVSLSSIIVNFFLTVFKLFAGIFSHSQAMVSDAIHSASDVLSTIVVMIGVKISSKASDDNHRYGHERFECFASVILAAMLIATSVFIGYTGISQIITGEYKELQMPGILALAAAIISIIIKEIMFQYTNIAAKKINSGSLKADAWHHRSDAISSVGSLIGIIGARFGFPIMDPLASIIICLIILKASFDIVKDAVDKLVDKSCDDTTIEEMKEIVMQTEGVLDIDDIKTRLFGNKIYVDIEICADGNQTLRDAHEIAEKVHHEIEQNFVNVKHCMVHVNPD